MTLEVNTIIDNLATCRAGGTEFRLNSGVFMDLIYGVTPDVIEKSLSTVRINNWINVVGADKALQKNLGLDRVPDTTKAMKARLKKLSRWRNNWAHGGDEEVSLSFAEVNEELEFLIAFSRALDSAVTKLIQTAKLP